MLIVCISSPNAFNHYWVRDVRAVNSVDWFWYGIPGPGQQ